MGKTDHMQVLYEAHTHAHREIVTRFRESCQIAPPFPFAFEEVAQAMLQTSLFGKLCRELAPSEIRRKTLERLVQLGGPAPKIQHILDKLQDTLGSIPEDIGEYTYKNLDIDPADLAILASYSPRQTSLGAFFTPAPLARQIAREAIANWIFARMPAELQELVMGREKNPDGEGLPISGDRTEDFYLSFFPACQRFVESGTNGQGELENLFAKVVECRIFDPTCGSGVFLAVAGNVILELAKYLRDAVADPTEDAALVRHIFLHNLHGVDLIPEHVRFTRNGLFLRVLPFLVNNEVLADYQILSQNILCENAILSPLREEILPNVPVSLTNEILEEICTCFLDVLGNNASEEDMHMNDLQKVIGGPTEDISVQIWREIAFCLGISGFIDEPAKLVKNILETLVPQSQSRETYDIILGNPPQEGARKETGRQGIYSWTTRVQRICIKYFQSSGHFSDLQRAWDFSLPFASHALEMLNSGGILAMLLPRAVGMQSFARKFFTLNAKKIRRVVYFTPQAGHFFQAWDDARERLVGVGNYFLVLTASDDMSPNIRFTVAEIALADYNTPALNQELRTEINFPEFFASPPQAISLPGLPLRLIVTITKGSTLCARAEWRRTRGSFRIRDLVTPVRDRNHPIRLVEPTHIAPFAIIGESFLEYHHTDFPDRVPANVHRWREDGFFQGRVLVTPLSKHTPSFAIIDKEYNTNAWRTPETVVLFKRWEDWFQEYPEELPVAVAKMENHVLRLLNKSIGAYHLTDPAQVRHNMLKICHRFSLETLAMILGSRQVHEYRLKNAKSFGKFEVGDWEGINLPFLEKSESDDLARNYDTILQILRDILRISGKKFKDVLIGNRPIKECVPLTIALENALFKENDAPILALLPAIDTEKIQQLREILAKSSQIVQEAYTRTQSGVVLQDFLQEIID